VIVSEGGSGGHSAARRSVMGIKHHVFCGRRIAEGAGVARGDRGPQETQGGQAAGALPHHRAVIGRRQCSAGVVRDCAMAALRLRLESEQVKAIVERDGLTGLNLLWLPDVGRAEAMQCGST
jgi:hypothetical protein